MDRNQEDILLQSKVLIQNEDLTPTIERLVKIEKWSMDDAMEACQQYRNYLFLKKKYGEQYILPPSYDIDEFWHAHILHTADYHAFCQRIFGYYLHHHPYHNKGNTIASEQFENDFENQTQKLYYHEFGEYIYPIKLWPICKKIFRNFSRKVTGFFKFPKAIKAL